MVRKAVVAKFGGTSMADATAMLQAAKIASDEDALITVVSATSGTTDSLIELSNIAISKPWPMSQKLLDQMSARHEKIANELEASNTAREHIKRLIDEARTLARGINLLRESSPKTLDSLMSIGERLSSILMTAAFIKNGSPNFAWFDARQVIKTDNQYGKAVPDIEKIAAAAKKLKPKLQTGKRFVTQGFIAQAPDGSTTTLGRGGSDYTASLFAEAFKATELQIWTDVAGIATTDPRICKNAQSIPEMSFQEAAELATSGAKILYAPSVIPARRSGIPVYVGHTLHPGEGGTWIKDTVKDMPLVRAISLKKSQILITLTTPNMVHAYGFLANVFSTILKHNISVDHVTTSEVSLAITLDHGAMVNEDLFKDLSEIANVEVEGKLSLISLIGNGINHAPGLPQDIFNALQSKSPKINVRMICQGASKHDFCFLVDAKNGEEAIKRLHKSFVEQK